MLKETLVIFATCWGMAIALAILSWLAPEAWWLVQFTWYHAGWVLFFAAAIWLGRQYGRRRPPVLSRAPSGEPSDHPRVVYRMRRPQRPPAARLLPANPHLIAAMDYLDSNPMLRKAMLSALKDDHRVPSAKDSPSSNPMVEEPDSHRSR